MDKYITNIINFITLYKRDKQHNEIWLRAQIGHQLDLYKQEVTGDYDNFTYPSLEYIRKAFEKTGLYTKTEIDSLITRYARLPKYKKKQKINRL